MLTVSDGGKQSAGLRLTRIVRDIADDGFGWTEHFSFRDLSDVAYGYRLFSF